MLMLLSLAAHAQSVPPTPGSVLGSFLPGLPALPVSPAQVVIPDQIEAPLHDRNGKRFQVHSFKFVGSTVFPDQRLKRVVQRFIDLELNLYDLGRAADAVTEFYHDRGYALARAVIPAQRVDDGVVTLVVVEGRVGGVLFTGHQRYDPTWLSAYTAPLAPDTVIDNTRMERSLLLLNDLPGLQARATLSPGARFGTSDVLIRLEETLIGGSFTLDNSGREETGQWRADLMGELNNPFGIGDQLRLRANQTEDGLSTFASIGYSVPIGSDGWRLAANYSDVDYELAGDFAALGIKGGARTADLTLSYPLTRSRRHNETLSLTARQTRLTQEAPTGKQVTDVPMLSLAYQGVWIGSDASVSTLMMQASSNGQRNKDGRSQDDVLLRLEVDGTYLLPLNRYWDFYARAAGAYSDDRLPDSEKYGVGGASSVRGYRSSELRGDDGWQTTLELRRRFTVWRAPLSVQLFGDIGRVTSKAPGFDNSYDGIMSWGVGLTAYPLPKTTLKIDVAHATQGDTPSDDKRTRTWASLITHF
jgi:hemolysin activation/secretion protein